MGSKKRERRGEEEEGSHGAPTSKKAKMAGPTSPETADNRPESPSITDPSSSERQREEEVERLQLLVAVFSSKQQDQYEIYRRSTFPKSTVRRLMQNVCGSSVMQNAVIAMAGMAKVYVGEVVEEACRSRDKAGEVGPLQPKHIREAARKLRQKGLVPNERHKKSFNFR